jgi:spore coat protein U-like protein
MKPERTNRWKILLVLWLGLFGVIGAHAQTCSVTNGASSSFGSVTSFAVKNTPQQTSATSAGIACGGAALGLFAVSTVDGVFTSLHGGYLLGPTGDKIPYSIYADSAYSSQVILGTTYNWASMQAFNFAGLFGGSGNVAIPLYLKTITGSNVAAGTYTDTLTVTWNWSLCVVGIGSLCFYSNGSGSTTITVTLVVTNDCTITAPNINFGAAPTVANFSPVTGSVSMVCTKGMTYTVGLNAGANAAANGRRQMASGSNRLQYDIYSGGVTVWGDVTNRVNSAGAADGVTTQSFPYTASIYTDQTTPPVGIYTDSVVVDVQY